MMKTGVLEIACSDNSGNSMGSSGNSGNSDNSGSRDSSDGGDDEHDGNTVDNMGQGNMDNSKDSNMAPLVSFWVLPLPQRQVLDTSILKNKCKTGLSNLFRLDFRVSSMETDVLWPARRNKNQESQFKCVMCKNFT